MKHLLFFVGLLLCGTLFSADITTLRTQAEAGVTDAQVELALAYLQGDGVPKAPSEAVYWFRKAAVSGNSAGEFCLGLSYLNGLGVTKNQERAVFWLRKAALQGNTRAQTYLKTLQKEFDERTSRGMKPSSAQFKSILVGSTTIVIPPVQGFVAQTAATNPFIKHLSLGMKSYLPLKLGFIETEDATRALPLYKRYMALCVSTEINNSATLTIGDFQEYKAGYSAMCLSSNFDAYIRKIVEESIRDVITPIDVSLGKINIFKVHETSELLVILMHMSCVTPLGKVPMIVAQASIHVKGKLIILNVYSSFESIDDIDWAKTQAIKSTQRILNANRE